MNTYELSFLISSDVLDYEVFNVNAIPNPKFGLNILDPPFSEEVSTLGFWSFALASFPSLYPQSSLNLILPELPSPGICVEPESESNINVEPKEILNPNFCAYELRTHFVLENALKLLFELVACIWVNWKPLALILSYSLTLGSILNIEFSVNPNFNGLMPKGSAVYILTPLVAHENSGMFFFKASLDSV